MPDQIAVQVSRLEAAIPEGIPLRWQGRQLQSGPLKASLDASSGGVLDYAGRQARLSFHVKLEFPELAEVLTDLGLDPAFSAPVRATIESAGDILENHSFALNGPCQVLPHSLFERAAARMLPGT